MWCLLFLPLLLSAAPSYGVQEFTDDNFDAEVRLKEFTLVMFYAPWCGHCKRLKPSFEAAAKTVFSELSNAALALVDCTTQTNVCARYQVSGYPTLKLFKQGRFEHDFDGTRDEKGIVDYLRKRSEPLTTELTSASHMDEILNSEGALMSPVLISFITSKSDALLALLIKIGPEFIGRVIFAHTHDSNVLGVPANKNHLRLFRPKHLVTKLTDPFVDYEGNFEELSIQQFILDRSHGLVGYRFRINQIFFTPENLVVFYHNVSLEKHAKGVNYYINRLIKLVQANQLDKIGFTYAYCYSYDFYTELTELGHDGATYPFVAIFANAKKYKLDKYEPDLFVQFVKDVKAGAIKPFVKSEPIPTEQTGALTKVVADNFEDVVNDPTKDVFIMFHAPWCGHCKQLMPKFEAVAEKMKDEPNFLMVVFDATANDVPPPYNVQSYPTLYFSPKSSKNHPKRYEGARETDDLVKFIASESSEELIGFDRSGVSKKNEL